jgi:microcystin-dependent protein
MKLCRNPAQPYQSSAKTHLPMNFTSTLPLIPRLIFVVGLAFSLNLATRAADSNPPERMTYQGYLVDANGVALGNSAPRNYDVIFRVYDDQNASASANRLWTEQQTITVDRGYFNVLLGEGSQFGSEPRPALSALFASATASERYLEITVKGIGSEGADVTIMPRLRLLSSPYAFLAKTAVNANNLVNNNSQQVVNVTATNVGINKANPGSALDVNGTVTATAVNVGGAVSAASFQGHGTIPLGGIIMWSGTGAPPAGWALCDGSTVNSRKTPDLRGRFVLGSGSVAGLTARSVNQVGGAETHQLSAAEMPVHNHPGSGVVGTGGAHAHNYISGWGSRSGIAGGSFNEGEIGYRGTWNTTTQHDGHSHPITVTVGNAGSGAAHNNMPPFYVLAFIMRVE